MGFWTLLTQRRMHSKLEQLAGRVAASSLSHVVARLCDDVPRMSAAEATGYVRARATSVVRAEISTVVAASSLSLTQRQQQHLFGTSLDLVTRHAIESARRSASHHRRQRASAA